MSRAYYACHLVARDRLLGVDAGGRERSRRPSHRSVIAVAVASPESGVDAEQFNRLKLMRENADYVRDPDHPETRRLFAASNVRDWADLANEALSIARALLPRLRTLPPA